MTVRRAREKNASLYIPKRIMSDDVAGLQDSLQKELYEIQTALTTLQDRTSGGSAALVTSVNGQTGDVVIDATTIHALTKTDADLLYLPLSRNPYSRAEVDSKFITKIDAEAAHQLLVLKTTTVNGHALTQNVTISAGDVGAYTKGEADARFALKGSGGGTSDVTKAYVDAQDAAMLAAAKAYTDANAGSGGTGGSEYTLQLKASEAIAAGKLVNIFNSGGSAFVRIADALLADRECHGFIKTSVAADGTATIYFSGANAGLTGLKVGRAYLGENGAIANQIDVGTFKICQPVGVAISPNTLTFIHNDPVFIEYP